MSTAASLKSALPGGSALPEPAAALDAARQAFAGPGGAGAANAPTTPPSTTVHAQGPAAIVPDVLVPDEQRKREKFIPVTRAALMDRLTLTAAWRSGEAKEVRRFFRYLDYWRQQQYKSKLIDLDAVYETFSPDSDLLMTRKFTAQDRQRMQARVVEHMASILEQANYERIDPTDVAVILTKETHYGLDLTVDFSVFEECLIYYRGASTRRDQRRNFRKFLRKEEFDVPIFQRLFLLFKLKPLETRIKEVMAAQHISHKDAEKLVKRMRAQLPEGIKDDFIYMKLFKNIPRTDIEMIFPNTQVKFRLLDKLKLGVTAGGGLGMGAVGAAGKLALVATNPIAAAGAAMGLGTIAFRQAMNFMNQKQRYMVIMAQNLYFHSMADNRGVIIKMADRAAEEDVKEEMLLYTILSKEPATRADLPAIDKAIERWLHQTFGVHVDFDFEDALDRLVADGIVVEHKDGTLHTLDPVAAAQHLDAKWDVFLDQLPDPTIAEGVEFEGNSNRA